jgi:hypothetical protein
MAAGTILGAMLGLSLSFESRSTSAFWALACAIVGLVVGVFLDRLKNRH